MNKHKNPLQLYFCILLLSLIVNNINAQSITTFTRVGNASTQSVVLAWDFEGTTLSPLNTQFTVEEVGSSTDITSSVEITVIENTAGTDYSIYVNLGDNYNHTDEFSLTYTPLTTTSADTYTIDTSASLESNVTRLSLNTISDTGESDSDGVTSSDVLLFTTNSTASNVIYLKSGFTTLGTTVGTGSNSLIVSSSLTDGDYSIYAYGVDVNGHITFTTLPVDVTIDTTDPTNPGTPTFKATAINDTGSSSSDRITSNTTPIVSISSLPLEIGNEIVIESDIDGEVGRANYSTATTEFTLSTLSEGVHNLICFIEDSAGNESGNSSALQFTIDTTSPSAPTLSLKSTSDTGRSDSDLKTNDTTPTFNIISESGTSLELSEGGNSKGTATSTGDDDITSSLVSSGSIYGYSVKATDVAGNISSISNTVNVNVKVNTISALTSPTLTSGSDSGDSGDNKTNDITPTYSFTSLNTSDSKELIISSSIDGEVARVAISSSNQNVTLGTLSEGNHTLTYNAEDIYGNVGTTATKSLVIDTTAPTLTSVTITSNNGSNSSMIANGNQSTITFVASETLKSSFNVTFNGSSVTPSKSGLTYTANRTFTSPGSFSQITFSIPVEDQAGNSSSAVTYTTNSSSNYLFPALSNAITAPGTVNYCASGSKNFTVNGSSATGGSGVYTYSWERKKNSGSFSSLGSYGEDFVETSSLTNGTYKYRRITTSEGINHTSNEVTVYINSDISSNTISSSSASGYCGSIAANSLIFTASTPTGGNSSYTYQWQKSTDGGVSWSNTSGTSATYTHNVTESTAGTFMFRRRVTSGGCTSFSNTLSYTLTNSISSNTVTNTSGTLVCINDGIVLVGSTPSGGNSTYSYQWQQSFNSGSYTNIGGATSQTYIISSVSTAGTYRFRRVVTSGNCTSTSTATALITVPAHATGYSLSPTTTNYSDQQMTGVALNVTGLGAGEDFYCSGTGVVSTDDGAGNNTFYPNLAGQGTHIVNYHITKGGCEKVEQVSFTVYDGASVINLNPLYCEDDAAVSLSIPGGTPSFVGGTPPYTLVRFEGTGTSGSGVPSGATFTPSTVVTSTSDGQNETVTITAVYEDSNPTPVEFSVSQAVTVTKNHVVDINLTQLNYCTDDGDFNVTANLNGSLTTDGTFTLNSDPPTTNPITISPTSLTVGNHTLTYNYTDGNGCAASDIVTISINSLPTVSFDYVDSGDDGDFCFDADTVFLQGKSGGSNVSSGTFSSSDALSGAIISYGDGTGAFIPALANMDEFELNEDFTITFTYTDGNSCLNSVDSTVTVFGYDEVTLARSSASDSVCYSEGDVTITPMEGGAAYTGTGVTWSIDTGSSGITTQMDGTILFHPSVAATNAGETSTSDYSMHIITYSYENTEGCTREVHDTLYVKPLPVAPTLVSTVPDYCSQDTGLQDLEVSGVTGAQFAWSSDATFTTILSTSNTLTPNDAPTVSVVTTVSYWVRQTNTESCTSAPLQVDITVYPKAVAPTLSLSNQTSYCSGETVSALSVATPGNSIKWYSDSGLSSQVGFGDSYTPAINTNVSADSTVTYYVTETKNGCEGLPTPITITIYKTPDAPTFNPVALVCSGGALSSISIASGSNVKWYSDAAGTMLLGSGNNYLPSFSTNVLNDSVVSIYATSMLSGCESNTSQVDININALPTSLSVNAISPYCEGEVLQSITATGEVGASFEWFSDAALTMRVGTSDVFDPMMNAPSYPTLDTLNYWVVQTAADGCVGPALKVDIPVYPTPSKPTVDSTNPLYCSGDVINAINVTSGSNIKWYDDALLSSIVSTNTSFTPPDPNSLTDYTQTYYVTQTVNGCESDTTQVTITINKRSEIPTVAATLSYCSGDMLQPMIVSSIVENVRWYNDASLTTLVGTGNTFTPTDPTIVTATTTYTYYVTDTHLGCEGQALQLDINVHPLPQFDLFGITEGQIFCQSDDNPLIITTVTGGVLTSSTGALIRTNNEIVLENSPLGDHTIRYTYTNVNGCVNFVERNFTIVDVPEVEFEYDIFCDTKTVQFRDLTTLDDSTQIVSWFYNFGVGEGSKFITDVDSAASYEHTFTSSGFKNVTLTVQTDQGCTNISTTKSIFIGDPPDIDFDWFISEHGAEMQFTEMSTPDALDTLDTWQWDFGDGTVMTLDADLLPNGAISHEYQNIGVYDVTLMVTTKRGCSRRLVKSVYVIPRVYLTNEEDEYFEDFNSSDGGWVHRGISSSWEHGIAQGENIISNTNVWVTNLTTDYNVSEDSYLNTPSFDLSGLSRPMIIFDMQLDAEAHIDGVTLQYSLDSGQNWYALGDVQDPINWFNSSDILADPGHQVKESITESKGWTGNTEESGGIFREFRSIRHNLDQFIGEEHLRLRFAFKSNSDLEDEGVAIDNIFIGNRKKVVVVETMTNAGQLDDSRELPDLDSVLNHIDLDVFAINYHIRVDGKSDSLNLDNPEPSSGRQFYYGINYAPSTIVDGNRFKDHTEDFINNYENIVASRALLDPKFDIDISLPNPGDPDSIQVTLTSNDTFLPDSSEIVVHIVTVEKEIFGVEVSMGQQRHYDVMKSMSPAPGSEGTSFFGRTWSNGSQEVFTVAWDNPQVYDTDHAEVIVFVQDNVTKEIYQAIKKDVSALVSTEPRNVTSIEDNYLQWEIYPNPTSDIVNIESPNFFYDCTWILSSTSGQEVLRGEFTGNTYSISLKDLPMGIYYIRHFNEGEQVGKPQKIVVVK